MVMTLANRKLLLAHLIFWVGYIGFVLALTINFVSWDRALDRILPGVVLQVALAYLNVGLLIPQLLKKKQYLYYVLAIFALILLLTWLRLEMYDWFQDQVRKDRPGRPGWVRFFGPTFWSLLQIWAISTAYVFLLDWFRDQRSRAELHRQQLETELKFLRNQISPHFLFNTLNNLYSLIHMQDERAGPVVLKLSDLLRYMLKESSQTGVALEKEVEFLKNYIELQRLKTDEPREVQFAVTGAKSAQQIAPLLLLNFFENAFKHGDWEKNPKGWIRAELTMREDGHLSFTLANTVRPGKHTGEIQEGIGLQNVRRRLALLYPGYHKLQILSDEKVFSVNLEIDMGMAND